MMIQLDRLTKSYGKARGICELSLQIPEGCCFGFIGPNGAGKSTTIRTLLGLIAPTSGSARVLGLDCTRQKREILSQVGYMPSEAMFYPEMRVAEVIGYSARLRRKDCRKDAEALCRALDLDGRKRIRELSLGNRKKVSIVCAMQHRPRLYILDEPTSGLDPLAQRTFWDLLDQRKQEGAGIFLSSHVLSEIQRHCQRAAIIREGRLLREGTVSELAGTGTRRVSLQGGGLPPGLSDVADVRTEANGVSFLYSGPVDRLLNVLSEHHWTDVHISEPELEEIFLHYYEGGVQQ